MSIEEDHDGSIAFDIRRGIFREIKGRAYESIRNETWPRYDDYHQFVTGLAEEALHEDGRWRTFVTFDVQDQAGQVADYLCPWAWKTLRGKATTEPDPQLGSKVVTIQKRDQAPLLAALDHLPTESLTQQQRRIITQIQDRLRPDTE